MITAVLVLPLVLFSGVTIGDGSGNIQVTVTPTVPDNTNTNDVDIQPNMLLSVVPVLMVMALIFIYYKPITLRIFTCIECMVLSAAIKWSIYTIV